MLKVLASHISSMIVKNRIDPIKQKFSKIGNSTFDDIREGNKLNTHEGRGG